MTATHELSAQWRNPGDILSLLLLIGGETVQKALAQLFGVYIQPPKRFPRIYLTPVAFSFGWVAYAFNSLTSVVGDKQLIPSSESAAIVINCDTGFARNNQSWVLGRILRDNEMDVEERPGEEANKLNDEELLRGAGLQDHMPLRISLRIDIFQLVGDKEVLQPEIDHVWILGWLTIAMQLSISAIPWALMPQWGLEKWPGRRLNKSGNASIISMEHNAASCSPPIPDIEKGPGGLCSSMDEKCPAGKLTTVAAAGSEVGATATPSCSCKLKGKPKTKTVCLTRGNGNRYAMVIMASGTAWDLEALATATSDSIPITPWFLGMLAIAWVCLLVSVSGLKAHAWFLVLVGGLGMLQNVYASSAPRSSRSMGLGLKKFEPWPTIIVSSTCEGKFWPKEEGEPEDLLNTEHLDPADRLNCGPLETPGARGAIRELEKTIPSTGFALMPVFFPALRRVDHERYRDAREIRFWKWMLKHPKSKDRCTD